MSKPIQVTVTGAGGQIAYNLIFPIAAGQAFGPRTPVVLRLLDQPSVPLKPLILELEDCAFPLLRDVVVTDDPAVAFQGTNWAVLVGAKPRVKGQERKDLIRDNAPIFHRQGRALQGAADDIQILVVGNPCNTNCLMARRSAPWIPDDRWFALTRLDHNRARSLFARKASVPLDDVTHVSIWGNHSATQYPDFLNVRIQGKPAREAIRDEPWLTKEFIETVQNRGAQVIQARGKSSAASAAMAILDHLRTFHGGTPEGDWTSAAVISEGSYGIPKGLVSSFPVRSRGPAGWEIAPGLIIDSFARERIAASIRELEEERAMAESLVEELDRRESGAVGATIR